MVRIILLLIALIWATPVQAGMQFQVFASGGGDVPLFSDTFTGTDGQTLTQHNARWTAYSGTANIGSNRAVPGAAGANSSVVDVSASNVTLSADLYYDSGGSYHLLTMRAVDANNHYMVGFYSGQLRIIKKVAGATSQPIMNPVSLVDETSYPVEITLRGPAVTINLGALGTYDFSFPLNPTATKFGVEMWNVSNSYIDNFKIMRAPVLGTANLVVFDGDSLTYGVGAALGSDYPSQTAALGEASGTTEYVAPNVGVGGQTIVQMIADGVAQVDAMYSASYAENGVVCWGGTNDLNASVATATVYNNIVSYCQARQAAGYKVVVLTILPRSSANANFEADRQTVNTSIKTNWATFADALVDVAGDNRIGDAGDNTDTTYYSADAIHLKATGYAIVAGMVLTALQGLGF